MMSGMWAVHGMVVLSALGSLIARNVSFVTCCHTLVIPLGDVTANQKLAAFLSCHVTVM